MRKFGIVLRYELREYLKNKGFVALTLILSIAGAVLLFLPRFVDMSGITGVRVVGNEEQEGEGGEAAETVFAWLNLAGVEGLEEFLELIPGVEWKRMDDRNQLELGVRAGYDGGFVVTGPTEYEYYVFNKSMADRNTQLFDEVLRQLYRVNYCAENGLDLSEITEMYNVPVTVSEQILNKDTESNYWYCYMLVMAVFMLIMLYGQMIAVSVTNEKSNRAIEVLVTSTSPNSLLFGKVIAGAVSSLAQVGLILGAILISYQVNRQQWGGMLDMFLHVPAEVLVTFAFFGLGGYLFYAFLYGALGALVSKTEDISKTVSGLMVVIMAVYFFSLIQLTNVDAPVTKVLSFLPISSYSTMFARIAMGTVAAWEPVVSFLILAVSIVGAGMLGAKIYRMGTLRYGNPIKLTTALKDMRKSD